MDYQTKLLDMRVAAEDAATNLELVSLFAEDQIVRNLPPEAPLEIRRLNELLLKTAVEARLAKGLLLYALELPLDTRLVNPPKLESGQQ